MSRYMYVCSQPLQHQGRRLEIVDHGTFKQRCSSTRLSDFCSTCFTFGEGVCSNGATRSVASQFSSTRSRVSSAQLDVLWAFEASAREPVAPKRPKWRPAAGDRNRNATRKLLHEAYYPHMGVLFVSRTLVYRMLGGP